MMEDIPRGFGDEEAEQEEGGHDVRRGFWRRRNAAMLRYDLPWYTELFYLIAEYFIEATRTLGQGMRPYRKSHEENIPLTAITTDLERGLDADVEPARPAANQDLGYRQRYIQNLAENIPSKKASVKEVKEFVTKVCVYREVADETVLLVNNGLLWTGEELHQLSKDDMVGLFRGDFLSKSQTELVVKDIIDIRKRAQAALCPCGLSDTLKQKDEVIVALFCYSMTLSAVIVLFGLYKLIF
ncbi:hypothetical protein CMUS01_12503 [Colletotrichum musicola]|uniref:Uncharacterized protein n=1 Tax=Colletotrichum musicola TaxID=2175873 RepID=A0A8H6JLW4_9PEZI|nr:hypothetical protein CMUS01_12503 [Colletotrichum musicola]